VTSPQLSGPPGKLMWMPSEARDWESSTTAESYPIIIRSYEPVAELDDRVERFFALLSLPPPEDFSALGPSVARSATRVGSDLVEPPLGTGLGDRCGHSEGDSGVSEGVMLSQRNSGSCRGNGFASAIPAHGSRNANPPW